MPDAIHQQTIDQKTSCQKNGHKWIAAGSLLTVVLSILYVFSNSSGNELPPSPSTTENRALVSIVSAKPDTYRSVIESRGEVLPLRLNTFQFAFVDQVVNQSPKGITGIFLITSAGTFLCLPLVSCNVAHVTNDECSDLSFDSEINHFVGTVMQQVVNPPVILCEHSCPASLELFLASGAVFTTVDQGCVLSVLLVLALRQRAKTTTDNCPGLNTISHYCGMNDAKVNSHGIVTSRFSRFDAVLNG